MLIIKCWMLKAKNLTLLSQKKWKKAGILTTVAKKIELCSIFFLQPGVAFWFDFNQNFVLYRMKVISGR